MYSNLYIRMHIYIYIHMYIYIYTYIYGFTSHECPVLMLKTCGISLWPGSQSFVTSLSVFLVPSTVGRTSFLSSAVDFSSASSLEFPSAFTWLSSSSGPSLCLLIHLHLLRCSVTLTFDIACQAICMSELVTIRQADLDSLIERLQGLIVEVQELKKGLHDWEVLDPPCYPEGTSREGLRDLHSCRGVESGPPDLPGFCISLAKSRLTGNWKARAERAFQAGFWAQVACDTCTNYTQPEPLRLQSCHWILLRAVGLNHPKRFTRKSDFSKFEINSSSVWCVCILY